MSSQPFDNYRNKGVEYDFVIQASIKLEELTDAAYKEIISLFNNEDFLAMFFPQIDLGRVYCKGEYLNNKLHITFGISLVDMKERPTTKDLIDNVKNYVLSLNKNIVQTPELDIKESDIEVDVLTENKQIIDNIDKKLVSENRLCFINGTNTQSFLLNDDGVVEQYLNEKLINSFAFSKLGIIRESKSIIQAGYTLLEANIETNNENNTDTEAIKQDLQQQINDVEEIEKLQTELNSKLDNLQESETGDLYLLVVYTNINGEFVPDVTIKNIEGNEFNIAEKIEDAAYYEKDVAEHYAEEFNNALTGEKQFILKAVNVNDIDNLKGLYESKEIKTEDVESIEQANLFPSNDNTNKELTKQEIENVKLSDILTVEQINWLQENIGTIDEIADSLKDMLENVSDSYLDDEPIVSIDKYVENLHNVLKGE